MPICYLSLQFHACAVAAYAGDGTSHRHQPNVRDNNTVSCCRFKSYNRCVSVNDVVVFVVIVVVVYVVVVVSVAAAAAAAAAAVALMGRLVVRVRVSFRSS